MAAIAAGINPPDKLARIVSKLCIPPVPLAAAAVLGGLQGGAGDWPSVVALVVGTAALPALFVWVLYRLGMVGNLDLTAREDRMIPSVFAVLCSSATWLILRSADAAPQIAAVAAAALIQGAVLAVVSGRSKISYHSASAGGLAAIAFSLGLATIGVAALGLAGLVGWSRVRLRCHTPSQVVAGLATALPPALLLAPLLMAR